MPLTCICEKCLAAFTLVFEDVEPGDAFRASIDIRSCQSGGVYAASVKCPRCGHEHEL